MRNLTCTIFFLLTIKLLNAADPHYAVHANDKKEVKVNAGFTLLNDTIFIYARGTTTQLPEGEAGFVKNLVIKNDHNEMISYRYAGDGNYILNNIKPGMGVQISYDLITTHKNYNWNHVGGVDEAAFTNEDGLFFVGYTIFIVPDLDMKNVKVSFELPSAWKASTPWKKINSREFVAESGRLLLNNCFMIGKHNETIINVSGMEIRLAIAGELSYAVPLIESTMKKLIPAYAKLFNGIPASQYLVAMSPERMTDGSAFRRSFSQIFKGRIDEKGIATWGYIMAHEIFHLWNGHSILPAGQEEWFKEGFTDYMTNLVLRRTGLINDEIVYQKIAHMASRYWYDRYWQRDTLSIRETGNQKEQFRFGVYGGGALVAMALEVEMRKATGNRTGVIHLMGKMFEEFAKKGKEYTITDIIDIVNNLTGKNLKPFFDKYVTGREYLDLEPFLAEMGLDFHTMIEEVYVSPNKEAMEKQKEMYRKIFIE